MIDAEQLDFDLFGDVIRQRDPIDALRRGVFKRHGELSKRSDALECRLGDLEARVNEMEILLDEILSNR